MGCGERFPRIGLSLLETQRDAALFLIDLEDDHIDFLRRRHDLARMDVLLGPGHFRHVDQAFDARLQLDERTVLGDVRDAARQLRADRVLGAGAIHGSLSSCFMPSEMRCVSLLMRMIWTRTVVADRDHLGTDD